MAGRYRDNGIGRIDAPSVPRLMLSTLALEGCGKTEFLKTMPRPLYVAYTDVNTEDVLGHHDGRDDVDDIYGKRLRLPAFKIRGDREDDIKDAAADMLDELQDFFLDVIDDKVDPPARSLALDTGSQAWDSILLADFGRTMKINPRDRGNANGLWRDLFTAVKEKPGLNLCVTHRCKQKWGPVTVVTRRGTETNDQPLPGEYERLGHKETGYLVNVEAMLMHDAEKGDQLHERFGIKIVRCTQRPLLIGTEQWGVVGKRNRRAASFPWLASQVFPETKFADWTEGVPDSVLYTEIDEPEEAPANRWSRRRR